MSGNIFLLILIMQLRDAHAPGGIFGAIALSTVIFDVDVDMILAI